MRIFMALLRRELHLALNFGTDTLGAMLFFILCGSLFPLALGPSPALLHQMGPGIIWVCALLAAILPLEHLFNAELADGSLDDLMLAGLPPAGLALVKICAHWLTTGLPVLLASLPLSVMFGLSGTETGLIFTSLLMGGATLSLLGGMAASLVLGARRGGVLLPLLVLPLSTPVLIFGAGASYAPQLGIHASANLDLLGGFLLFTLPLCPLTAGSALREACK